MEDKFWELIYGIRRPGIEYAADWLLYSTDFMTAPASTCYHGAWKGGLIEHSIGVALRLIELTTKNSILWDSPDSPAIIGLFHDACKADMYKLEMKPCKDDSGQWTKKPFYYVDDRIPLGHGEKSALLLAQHIHLTPQELYCVRWHMSSYESLDERRASERAIAICPEIMWVRAADKFDAALNSVVSIIA